MDLSSLDATIHGYCYLGLAQSTHKAYKVAVNRFTAFCAKFNVVNPFPVDELLLCRFVASLAQEGLSPSTIKSYLAGVRNAQISKGLPEPDKACTMPRLKLLQAGVAKARATGETPSSRKQRLPITPVILNGILSAWVTPSALQSTQRTTWPYSGLQPQLVSLVSSGLVKLLCHRNQRSTSGSISPGAT